jgi:phosphomannomutase/phosphoglucomutase
MPINAAIFREYDIRGIVDTDLTPEIVQTLGRAMGTYFLKKGKRRVALGRDCRLSSPAFAAAMSDGLRAVGCDVTDLGTIPTPLLYSRPIQGHGSRVMITGSHNPPNTMGSRCRSATRRFTGRPSRTSTGSSGTGLSLRPAGRLPDV